MKNMSKENKIIAIILFTTLTISFNTFDPMSIISSIVMILLGLIILKITEDVFLMFQTSMNNLLLARLFTTLGVASNLILTLLVIQLIIISLLPVFFKREAENFKPCIFRKFWLIYFSIMIFIVCLIIFGFKTSLIMIISVLSILFYILVYFNFINSSEILLILSSISILIITLNKYMDVETIMIYINLLILKLREWD